MRHSLLNLFQSCGPVAETMVRRLLDIGADPNERNCYGRTPLMFITLKFGHANYGYAFAKMLIEKGANINIRDNSGFSALSYLLTHRDPNPDKDMVELFLSNDANPYQKEKFGKVMSYRDKMFEKYVITNEIRQLCLYISSYRLVTGLLLDCRMLLFGLRFPNLTYRQINDTYWYMKTIDFKLNRISPEGLYGIYNGTDFYEMYQDCQSEND